MIEIKVPQISYAGCEILEGEPDYLALHPTHVEYKWKFKARIDLDEDGLIKEDRSFNGIATIPKNQISHTEAGYTHDKEMFQISIKCNRDEIVMVVDSMKTARAIHKQIVDWLYTPEKQTL